MSNNNAAFSESDLLICPITYRLFHDPVTAEDGQTYERQAIVDWIQRTGVSPITRQRLTINGLRSNQKVKKLVEDFELRTKSNKYLFRVDVDVRKKGNRPLFKVTGKCIWRAEWLNNTKNGPSIVLLRISGVRAQKEASFYVELSNHPHVVHTYGLVDDLYTQTLPDSVTLLQEYAPEGNLCELLQEQTEVPSDTVLFEIFIQISDAMIFLTNKCIIHGDLACRNVLVFRFDANEAQNNLVKLTDFGLSQASTLYTYIDNSAKSPRDIIPVRYAAPEILIDNSPESYSERSDVYSMGVLMWESFSKGEMPWSLIINDDAVCQRVIIGERLSKPAVCNDENWLLIYKWSETDDVVIPCDICTKLISANVYKEHTDSCPNNPQNIINNVGFSSTPSAKPTDSRRQIDNTNIESKSGFMHQLWDQIRSCMSYLRRS
ncbi:unnamed protein product [Didymodactylos carnosus]|uniref:Non-specific protein-tyrosine kinase n=1 Tax=Didymodactylos carnosus TaxID=1234261 RepID=A0A8S2DVA0_9BILA|nr:unnamed protein product [Didymodactylos carnosus]CAF3778665.1 unnamed protein product [Didymodactylos carnosus]